MLPRAAIATLTPHDDIVTALAALHASPEGRALVVDGGRPVGTLSRADLQHIGPVAGVPSSVGSGGG
jgi:CBS domain-containing protein